MDKSQIMKSCKIALSGFVNPLRSELRKKILEMGAAYETDWSDDCTHLVCAELDTPKYLKARKIPRVKIVTKEWVHECYKDGKLLWADFYRLDTSNVIGAPLEIGDQSRVFVEEPDSSTIVDSPATMPLTLRNNSASSLDDFLRKSLAKVPSGVNFLSQNVQVHIHNYTDGTQKMEYRIHQKCSSCDCDDLENVIFDGECECDDCKNANPVTLRDG